MGCTAGNGGRSLSTDLPPTHELHNLLEGVENKQAMLKDGKVSSLVCHAFYLTCVRHPHHVSPPPKNSSAGGASQGRLGRPAASGELSDAGGAELGWREAILAGSSQPIRTG